MLFECNDAHDSWMSTGYELQQILSPNRRVAETTYLPHLRELTAEMGRTYGIWVVDFGVLFVFFLDSARLRPVGSSYRSGLWAEFR